MGVIMFLGNFKMAEVILMNFLSTLQIRSAVDPVKFESDNFMLSAPASHGRYEVFYLMIIHNMQLFLEVKIYTLSNY